MGAKEKKERFVQYSKQLRDAIRNAEVPPDNDEPVENSDNEINTNVQQTAEIQEINAGETGIPPLDLKSTVDVNKPAWALTEDDAVEREELKEDQDLDQLLDFVGDLDFESYIDDLEVRQ